MLQGLPCLPRVPTPLWRSSWSWLWSAFGPIPKPAFELCILVAYLSGCALRFEFSDSFWLWAVAIFNHFGRSVNFELVNFTVSSMSNAHKSATRGRSPVSNQSYQLGIGRAGEEVILSDQNQTAPPRKIQKSALTSSDTCNSGNIWLPNVQPDSACKIISEPGL
jgi:hypothetical protein